MLDLTPPLRALGLEYFNTLFRRWKAPSGESHEMPKKVWTRSYWHMIARSLIHVLPMTVLCVLIWLNYSDRYIGPTFIEDPEEDTYFLAGLQICAKLEELLCVASLTAIVLQALRHELTGDGVPIGLLGSAIWFSSLSAFWSPDFLGSFSWTLPSLRRLRFYALLVVCGAIAATIGPASAILMIPRFQNVPAGGTSFYINSTAAQLWPDAVVSSTQPGFCSFANSSSYAVCPSAGYKSLSNTLTAFNYTNFCQSTGQSFAPLCQAMGAEGNRNWENLLIQSPGNFIPPVLNSFRTLSSDNAGASVIQPHAATVALAQRLVGEWTNAVGNITSGVEAQYKWTYDIETLGSATSPYVRTRCTHAQNLSASTAQAAFPYIIRSLTSDAELSGSTQWASGFRKSTILGLDRNESSQIRSQWMPLALGEFGDLTTGHDTTGLLIELPWTEGSRAAIGCAVTAAWHDGTVQSVRSANYDAWTVLLSEDEFGNDDISPLADQSNRLVTLDKSWLDLLTMASPSSGPSPTAYPLNTLEQILNDTGVSNIPSDLRHRLPQCGPGLLASDAATLTDTQLWNADCADSVGIAFIEAVVAMMVADGLSRHGSHSVFNVQNELQDWTPSALQTFNESRVFATYPAADDGFPDTAEAVSEWLAIYVVGWAYYPQTVSDHLALTAICVYLALAAAHLFYSFIPKNRESSSAWESITELLVLCLNSPASSASSALKNTSAGIHELKTYGTAVKIRAVEPENETGPAKLALVLAHDLTRMGRSAETVSGSDGGNPARDTSPPNGEMVSESIKLMDSSSSSSSSSSSLHSMRGALLPQKLQQVETDVYYS